MIGKHRCISFEVHLFFGKKVKQKSLKLLQHRHQTMYYEDEDDRNGWIE